jgi:hypothetical protein
MPETKDPSLGFGMPWVSVHPPSVLPYYGIVKPMVLGKVPGEAVKASLVMHPI